MKKLFKRTATAVLLSTVLLSSVFSVHAANEVGVSISNNEMPYQSYTYWSDVNASEKIPVYSKPMYKNEVFFKAIQYGGNDQSLLNDVVARNGKTYILDGGLGRVYILDQSYSLLSTVTSIKKDGESIEFIGAQGIYVDEKEQILIADTENARVIVTDDNSGYIGVLELPDSPLIPTGFKYKPIKVAVDQKGYTYIVSEGSYYGAILYSPKKEFLGFFGANTVKGSVSTVLANLFNRLFSNDTKRAADELSLPYTLTDITLGTDNFIYTATGRTSDSGTIQTGQICMYNPGGNDVLKASSINFADYSVASVEKAQNILGIEVDENGFIYLLDGTYGRIFLYDKDCNILSVFGGSYNDSNQTGGFYLPTAIALNGEDIIISDRQKNGITVFKITDYGSLMKQADTLSLKGDSSSALNLWQLVIKQDSNSQLGYRAIAKAYLENNDFERAIEYSSLGYDRETYGKAFKNIRNEWIENNFTLISISTILFVGIVAGLIYLKKKRNIIIFKTEKSKCLGLSMAHPVESFRKIKEKQTGSLVYAVIILITFYIITVLNDTLGGFTFTVFDSESYNALYVFLSTVGLVVLWTFCNWLICSLLDGIGTIKEIFIVSCYCLVPIILAFFIKLGLTHILIQSEAAFLSIMVYAFVLYAAFMLILGIMQIHDYGFGKFIATTVLSLVAMLIIIFLLFLIIMLAQQVFGWVLSVLVEIKNRI